MSGLAAVVRSDGSPGDLTAVQRMAARLAHRGGDAEGATAVGEAALAHRHSWATPEEVGETQPLSDPSGRYWIVCDGRVDSRDELLPTLGASPGEGAGMSDAAVLLEVFARWGVAGFARVVGPFAAAIWDATERRLTLVRDALGDRPLCYALLPGAVVAASEEQAVLAHPGVSDALDERRVAQFFAFGGLDGDATFFTAVREVLPGHALVVESGRATTVRYWEAAAAEPLRLRDDREVAEAFAERLRAAVRAHLRGTTPPALMLSGGLDSSAIAATAAPLAPGLKAVSWVFDELPSCDERAWIDPVVRHCGLEPLQFAGDAEWPLRELAGWRRNPNSPEDDLYRRLVERARELARSAGCTVLLSGMFGDHLYSGVHGWLWERLGDGRALGDARTELRGRGGLRRLGVALLPRRVPAPVKRLRRAMTGPRPWLTRYAGEMLAEAGAWPPSAARGLRPAQHRSVLGLLAAHGVSGETFHAASAGVDVRYPFRDRRVVELMLRLPSDQLYRPGVTRPVLREAMRGLLPEAVRSRTGKTSLEALFRRGVGDREQAAMQRQLAAGAPHWERFVRPEWVAARTPGRAGGDLAELVLCSCILFGRWLDNVT